MYDFKINLKSHLYFGNTIDKMEHAEHSSTELSA